MPNFRKLSPLPTIQKPPLLNWRALNIPIARPLAGLISKLWAMNPGRYQSELLF
jgi:hypothetical protein